VSTVFGNVKLGLNPSAHDDRTLRLENYTAALPKAPASVDYAHGVPSYPMLGNDQYGDCAVVTPGHMEETWTYLTQGKESSVTTAQILKAYSAITGFDKNDPSTDQGSNPLDVLRYWRKTGIANRKILAFATVKPKDLTHVQQATWLFGGLYLALQLPNTAKKQKVWDVVSGSGSDSAPGSWGGHAVNITSYDQSGFTVITWGQRLKMTQRFLQTYCSEAWAVLSSDWLKANKAPSGFDLATLQKDLSAVTG
jgi:hypothetical protein